MNGNPEKIELRIQMLLRNGLTSKSGHTLADSVVLTEIATRLGYDLEELRNLDITNPLVNPWAKLEKSKLNSRRKSR